jgi:hypothetical protein
MKQPSALQRGKKRADYEAISNWIGSSFFLYVGQRFSRPHERFVPGTLHCA